MWIGFVFSHPLNTAWFSLSPHPCCRAGTAPFPHSSGWALSSAQAHFWELGAYRTLLTFILTFISSHLSPLRRESLSEISSPKLVSWVWSVFFFQREKSDAANSIIWVLPALWPPQSAPCAHSCLTPREFRNFHFGIFCCPLALFVTG